MLLFRSFHAYTTISLDSVICETAMSSLSVFLFLLLVFDAVWLNAQRTSCDRYNCDGCSNSDLDDIRQSLKKMQQSLEQQNYFLKGQLNRCPTGFKHNATGVNKCYAIDLEATDRDSAQAKCRALNPKAHLAVINSPLENQIISEILNEYNCLGFLGRNWFWTSGGRQDNNCSSPLVWKSHTSNNQAITYTNFCPEEPSCSTLNVQSCMTFAKSCYSSLNINGWQEHGCPFSYCSICEVMML